MATILDSLMVELGLDSSKFMAEQKKVIDALKEIQSENEKLSKANNDNAKETSSVNEKASEEEKKAHTEKKKASEEDKKSDEESSKRAKQTQVNNKTTTESYSKLGNAIGAFGASLIGVSAYSNFVSGMMNTNAALSRNSELFNMSAHEISSWGGVLKRFGGETGEFENSMQAIQTGIANIRLGNPAIQIALSQIGALGAIDLSKGTIDLFKYADAIKAFRLSRGPAGEQQAFAISSQINMSKALYMASRDGAESLRKYYDESEKVNKTTEGNTKAANELKASWTNVDNSITGVKNKVMDQMTPSLIELADNITDLIKKGVEWDDQLGGIFSKTGALTGTLLSLAGVLRMLSIIPGPIGVAAKIGSVALAAAGIGVGATGIGAGAIEAGVTGTNVTDKKLSESGQKLKEDMQPFVEETAKKYGVTKEYINRIVDIESSWDANAKSRTSSATGLGQFTADTWETVGMGSADRNDPYKNIEAIGKLAKHNMSLNKESFDAGKLAFQHKRGGSYKGQMIEDDAQYVSYVDRKSNTPSFKPETPLTEDQINNPISSALKTGAEKTVKSWANLLDPKGYFDEGRNQQYLAQHSQMVGSSATVAGSSATNNNAVQNNTITVNSNATDGKAVAREIPKELENSSVKIHYVGTGS